MMRTATGSEVAWIDSCAVAFCCWEVGRCGRRTRPTGEMMGAVCRAQPHLAVAMLGQAEAVSCLAGT
jgi:hypothetical protein